MSRLSEMNRTLLKEEKKKKKKKKGKQKKNWDIPEFDEKGKVVASGSAIIKKRIRKAALIAAAIVIIIYVPQFFIRPKAPEDKKVDLNSSAVTLSTNILKSSGAEDFDNDGIPNSEELEQNTNSWFIDTDDDGASDYCEMYITKTKPNKADEGLLSERQKKVDDEKGNSYRTPYKIGNVFLWADSYTSKGYGSVVETANGYRFSNFSGYAQFPKAKGDYVYTLANGIHTLKEAKKDEKNVYKISPYETIEIYQEPLEETIDLGLFGIHFYLDKNFITDKFAMILPDRGLLTAQTKAVVDVTPDTEQNVIADIIKTEYDKTDATRFTMNTNTIENLQYVKQTIDNGNCIMVSLYKPSQGEFVGIVYGYTKKGNLMIADEDLNPIGELKITETARKIMVNEEGLASYAYFDFDGFGFHSKDHDRISFFASTGETGQELQKGNGTSPEEETTEEGAGAEENAEEGATETDKTKPAEDNSEAEDTSATETAPAEDNNAGEQEDSSAAGNAEKPTDN